VSELESITCHMGSHTADQAKRPILYLPTSKKWKAVFI